MKKVSLTDVKGIGPSTASILSEHGITSVEQLAEAGVEALASIPGFSSLRALAVTSAAAETLRNASPAPEPAIAEKEGPKKGKKRKKTAKGKKKTTAEKKNKKKKKGKKGNKQGKKKKK